MRGYQYGSARALLAFEGRDTRDALAMVGALLWVEEQDNLRFIVNWLKGFTKANSKGAARRSGLYGRGRGRKR